MTETVRAQRNTVSTIGFVNPLTLAANAEEASHVFVYANDELLVNGVDYTLEGVGDTGDLDEIPGVEVWIEDPGPLAYEMSATTFTVVHSPPLDQGNDISAGGRFGSAFENALDAVVRRQQAQGDLVARSAKLPVDAVTIDMTLPQPSARRAILWNDTGTGFVNSFADPDTTGLVEAAAFADAAEASSVEAETERIAAQAAQVAAEDAANRAEDAAAEAGDISALLIRLVPTGTTILFAGTSAPTGYLKENGAAISRSTYSELFTQIGTTFGAGNGTTTFNLPESRGEFFRGLDDGRGVDSGRTLASAQSGMVGPHSHVAEVSSAGNHTHAVGVYDGVGSGSRVLRGNGSRTSQQTSDQGGAHSHTVTIENNTGTETRPRNVARLACIKF